MNRSSTRRALAFVGRQPCPAPRARAGGAPACASSPARSRAPCSRPAPVFAPSSPPPSTGVGLIVTGSVFTGNRRRQTWPTAPICKTSAIPQSTQTLCLGATLAFAGVTLVIGVPHGLAVGGEQARHVPGVEAEPRRARQAHRAGRRADPRRRHRGLADRVLKAARGAAAATMAPPSGASLRRGEAGGGGAPGGREPAYGRARRSRGRRRPRSG